MVTPAPKTNREDKATPPPPEASASPFAKANSTTHRAEWMSFGRRMESADASTKFPELMGLWSAGRDVPCLLSRYVVYVRYYSQVHNVFTCIYTHIQNILIDLRTSSRCFGSGCPRTRATRTRSPISRFFARRSSRGSGSGNA